jgi:hypothetical protein
MLARAVITGVPAPLKPLPSLVKLELPPDVNTPNCKPLAPTALASEPPEAVGSDNPPRLDMEILPFMVASPSTKINKPLQGWSVVKVWLASIVKPEKLATNISPS